MSDEKFKLPGSSYSELVKVIRAYGAAGDDASLDVVAQHAAMDKTQVSRNNGFLLAVDVATGGQKKSLTTKGRSLAHALDHEIPTEIQRAWRDLVEDSDFAQKIISAVRIRGGMDETSLRGHIAYTAGQPRTPNTSTGAGSVVEIFTVAGSLREEDGRYLAADRDVDPSVPAEEETSLRGPSDPRVVTPVFSEELISRATSSAVGVTIQVRLTVACEASDLDDIGVKLRKLIADIGASGEEEAG